MSIRPEDDGGAHAEDDDDEGGGFGGDGDDDENYVDIDGFESRLHADEMDSASSSSSPKAAASSSAAMAPFTIVASPVVPSWFVFLSLSLIVCFSFSGAFL